MFIRGTRRRGNEGRKTRAHTTVWHAGCRPTDCLSPINGLPSLRLTHSNPRGGFSTARLRGPRVHTHGADTILLRSKKTSRSSLSISSFSLFCIFLRTFSSLADASSRVLWRDVEVSVSEFYTVAFFFFFFNSIFCTLLRAQELKFRF